MSKYSLAEFVGLRLREHPRRRAIILVVESLGGCQVVIGQVEAILYSVGQMVRLSPLTLIGFIICDKIYDLDA